MGQLSLSKNLLHMCMIAHMPTFKATKKFLAFVANNLISASTRILSTSLGAFFFSHLILRSKNCNLFKVRKQEDRKLLDLVLCFPTTFSNRLFNLRRKDEEKFYRILYYKEFRNGAILIVQISRFIIIVCIIIYYSNRFFMRGGQGGSSDDPEYLYILGLLYREWLWELWDSTYKLREWVKFILSNKYLTIVNPYAEELLVIIDRYFTNTVGDLYDMFKNILRLLILFIMVLPLWTYRAFLNALVVIHAILTGQISLFELFGSRLLHALEVPARKRFNPARYEFFVKNIPRSDQRGLIWSVLLTYDMIYLTIFYTFLFFFSGWLFFEIIFDYHVLTIGANFLKLLNKLLSFFGATKPLFREFSQAQVMEAVKAWKEGKIEPYHNINPWLNEQNQKLKTLPTYIKSKIKEKLRKLVKILLYIFIALNTFNILYLGGGFLAILSRYLYGFKKLPYFVYDFLEAYENAGRYNAPFYGSRVDTGLFGQGINPDVLCNFWWLSLTKLLIDPRPKSMKNRMNFEMMMWDYTYIKLMPHLDIFIPFIRMGMIQKWDPSKFGTYYYDWKYYMRDPNSMFHRWPKTLYRICVEHNWNRRKVQETVNAMWAERLAAREKARRKAEQEREAEKAAAAEKRAAEIKAQREAAKMEAQKEAQRKAAEKEAKIEADKVAAEREAEKELEKKAKKKAQEEASKSKTSKSKTSKSKTASKSKTKNPEAKQESKTRSKKTEKASKTNYKDNSSKKNNINKNGKNHKNKKK